MNRNLGYSALLTILLGSSTLAFAAQYTTRIDQNFIRTGYIRTDFCLGSEFQMKTGLNISRAESITVRMRGRTLDQTRNNRLIVNDNYGIALDSTPANLFSQLTPISIQIYSAGNSDICLNSEREGVLENIEIDYSITESRPQHPPRPPMSTVLGAIETISSTGEVLGWGCDTRSRQELNLNVYINGIANRNIRAEGNLDVRDDRRMGLPDRDCGNYSGFKFQLPKEIMYGQNINVEVRGEERNGNERSFGTVNYKTPIYLLDKGLFEVIGSNKIYFSNGYSAFCHVSTPDQVRLFLREGLKDPKTVENLPIGMRNDGVCELKRLPVVLFKTLKTNNPQAVYFSNGSSYCWVPEPGMIAQIAEKNGIRADLASFDNVPGNMQFTNLCKAEGLFSVGPHIYYSNGTDAFCHVTDANSIGNRKVYPYGQLPPEQRNDGDCR